VYGAAGSGECAQGAMVRRVSAGTNTGDVCVPRWRELSRNKSRDEREMWPNRTAHTDTVSRGRGKKRGGDVIAAGSLSLAPLLLAVRPFHGENFRVTTRSRQAGYVSSPKMNPLCGDLA